MRALYRGRTSDEWVFVSERGPFIEVYGMQISPAGAYVTDLERQLEPHAAVDRQVAEIAQRLDARQSGTGRIEARTDRRRGEHGARGERGLRGPRGAAGKAAKPAAVI